MQLVHGTAILLGCCGVMLTGASGSGKTTLALELINRTRLSGRFATLVADDQVNVTTTNARLVARAPAALAGLAEIYGLSPRPVEAAASAVIDLVCDLRADAPRFQDPSTADIAGMALPSLILPQRSVVQSAGVIVAWLNSR